MTVKAMRSPLRRRGVLRRQHGDLPVDLWGELQLRAGIGDHVITQLREPIHLTNHGIAEALAAIVHGDDHRGRKLVVQRLGLGGVDGEETADGDQQGGEAAQLLLLFRRQVTAQVAEVGDAALTVAEDVDGVGTALGAVFIIVPGADSLHCKRGGGALTQGYTLSPAVVAVAMAAQGLVSLDADRRKSRYAAVLVWVKYDPVTL